MHLVSLLFLVVGVTLGLTQATPRAPYSHLPRNLPTPPPRIEPVHRIRLTEPVEQSEPTELSEPAKPNPNSIYLDELNDHSKNLLNNFLELVNFITMRCTEDYGRVTSKEMQEMVDYINRLSSKFLDIIHDYMLSCDSGRTRDIRSTSTCTLEGCVHAARILNSTMNRQADPCVDFYQYTCGGNGNQIRFNSSLVNTDLVYGSVGPIALHMLLNTNQTADLSPIRLQQSYGAYIWLLSDVGSDDPLPGFEDFSAGKMFWIYVGNSLCQTYAGRGFGNLFSENMGFQRDFSCLEPQRQG